MQLINQDYFKKQCKYSFDNEPNGFGTKKFIVNEDIDNNWYYVKTDYVQEFFTKYKPDTPYILYTGKSDHCIDSNYINILNDPLLTRWNSVNVNFNHRKLKSIPIGLMDSWWYEGGYSDCGNNKLILEYMNRPKTENVLMNFNIGNNVNERGTCFTIASQLKFNNWGYGLGSNTYAEYLDQLSRHRFCLCPEGNGIDTHRIWESIYVKTVPIVKRSINIEFYTHLPILIVDEWTDLREIILREGKYNEYENFEFNLSMS